ncbi:hypothetical protein Emed_006582 [Eimeria media]
MRRVCGLVLTLGLCGSFPFFLHPASAASRGRDFQQTSLIETADSSSPSDPKDASIYQEETYSLREHLAPPSASLRVTDAMGRTTEIPIDFTQARVEPRGFWGDVAVNGMALFSASLCIILLKEFLSWSAARRQKAKIKAQREMEARRRAAISRQLEAADLELRTLKTTNKEGKGKGIEDDVRRLMDLFDAYRQELKDYDAPALMAYLDSLVLQATHLLRTHQRTQTEREAAAVVDTNRYSESAPKSRAAEPVKTHEQEAAEREAAAASASPVASSAATETTMRAASPSNSTTAAASSQTAVKTPEMEVDQPDIDLVHRVVMANPGMQPAEALRVARELTLRRRQSRLREP